MSLTRSRYFLFSLLSCWLLVWDALNGKPLFTYRGHSAAVWDIAWSPDGKNIASASKDANVQVWDAVTGRNMVTYRGHTKEVWAVSWSPDGTQIASVGDESPVQVWIVTTSKLLLSLRP
jgi:eukaryotic-like serine/threonine-protein kinase